MYEEVAMRASSIGVAIVLLICSLTAQTDQSALVTGVVTDASGSVLPGVRVSLVSVNGGVSRDVMTDEKGEFDFGLVQPGRYTVSATLEGFQFHRSDVSLSPNDRKKISIEMTVGMLAETLTVSAQTPTVNASRSERRGQRPDFNTESYSHIESNRFHTVKNDPRSTFSIDVDTASYANVRRFIQGGALPPADAVRIEELINYFEFQYAQPTGDMPFSVTTEVARCPWNTKHYLALIGLQGRHVEVASVPPRNLVFLLDVSGSMDEPNKLPLVKSAMMLLADTLREQDRVAIVVYAGASGLALRSTTGDQKTVIRDAIARLRPGGSTNGASGIMLAYQIAAENFIAGGVNRVILATDGDFNVGVTSDGELIRLIEKKRDTGVFLSVLGVGTGNLKDSRMEQLADKGNGNYSYLDSLHEAHRVLVAHASGTLVTIAKDVKLQIEFNPRTVSGYRLVGYENRLLEAEDFNDDAKDAGEMGAGHTVTALYEIVPAGQSIDRVSVDPLKYQRPSTSAPASRSAELMTVKVRYKGPASRRSQLVSTVVPDAVRTPSTNLGFAASVAEFGMLLRNSEYRGAATHQSALELARTHRGADPDGYRAEFIRLVELASRLK